jgi:hypothetical protein
MSNSGLQWADDDDEKFYSLWANRINVSAHNNISISMLGILSISVNRSDLSLGFDFIITNPLNAYLFVNTQ